MIEIQKILVPCDFSASGNKALQYGCELAEKFDADLHLLNVREDAHAAFVDPELSVIPLGELMQEQHKLAVEKLQSMPESGISSERTVVRNVRAGTPFVEIIQYASEQDIDLIVIGTHGRTGLVHMLLGSVAEKVVRKAGCPVLVVRTEEHDFVKP